MYIHCYFSVIPVPPWHRYIKLISSFLISHVHSLFGSIAKSFAQVANFTRLGIIFPKKLLLPVFTCSSCDQRNHAPILFQAVCKSRSLITNCDSFITVLYKILYHILVKLISVCTGLAHDLAFVYSREKHFLVVPLGSFQI
jgi:hypothetical protein